MRFTAALLIAAFAGPALAQQAPVQPQPAPPEGFYRDIPNAYDLLARPQAFNGNTLILKRDCREKPAAPNTPAIKDQIPARDCSAETTRRFIESLKTAPKDEKE